MDNWYSAPQLFSLIWIKYNLRGMGTCRANRKVFDSEQLLLDKKIDRVTLKILVEKRLFVVITIWKDSKNLHVVSTKMTKCVGRDTREKGGDSITVKCPNYIITYQKQMGGFDHGYQHRLVGAGLSNLLHFKIWYKK